ncbi:MAG: hypoxanthine phosphoribosyltransferase [Dehalococcoidia bacterium]
MARSALLAPPTRPPQEAPTPPPRFAHDSEAEFARILTFYGITWDYEPRSFPLREAPDGQLLEAFTPDFYLPDYDQYIELTTIRQSLATYKNRKLRLMRERYPEVNVKLLNRRDLFTLLAKFGIDPRGSSEVPQVDRVLFSEEEIATRIAALGEQISEDYAGRELVLVGVLRGVACFMADLMRAISIPVHVDFLALSQYQPEGGSLRFTKSLEEPVAGKDVLVVEDVVDTGMSLHRLLQYVGRRDPASVRVCTLLDKRVRRLVDVPIDYTGFEIPDEFVVGYGLDYQQQYRNLPFIATLKRPSS